MNRLFTLHAAMMQVDGLIALTERKLRTLYELRLSLHHRLLTTVAGTPCEDDAPCAACIKGGEHRRAMTAAGTPCAPDAPPTAARPETPGLPRRCVTSFALRNLLPRRRWDKQAETVMISLLTTWHGDCITIPRRCRDERPTHSRRIDHGKRKAAHRVAPNMGNRPRAVRDRGL